MGQKLVKYYEFAAKNGGLPVQMRIAMATGVTSANAATVPDTPDVIEKFKNAIKQITGKDAPAV